MNRRSNYNLSMALTYIRLAYQSASKDQDAAAKTVAEIFEREPSTYWRIRLLAVALASLVETAPAEAKCHHYSVWNYPWAQGCSVTGRAAAGFPHHLSAAAHNQWAVEITKVPPIIPPLLPEPPKDDMPVPSLEDTDFPPDCDADWCQRLKGVGMLRDHFGTNQ